ncbi:uncharacterized protein ANIA_11371 [Aspergillus nidulans FGSC A4]|uniref:Uncharacterized protein n=1 Tax=Emericella nidulans (strain FGSC A4 / ATCC 38163 / CBS 112.46 / NRRL 194 / M139) TaxID=227321 RepID=C8VJE4_EMENI|nr:hypothetical protein [Aspergillus nidulans FGSC A4]CBF83893.1 TPA: hypothetical protein ANIA_11371 [Aspergillus nidulans FGSC A4]
MTLPGRYVLKRWHPATSLEIHGSASGTREIITVPAVALETKLMGLSLYAKTIGVYLLGCLPEMGKYLIRQHPDHGRYVTEPHQP